MNNEKGFSLLESVLTIGFCSAIILWNAQQLINLNRDIQFQKESLFALMYLESKIYQNDTALPPEFDDFFVKKLAQLEFSNDGSTFKLAWVGALTQPYQKKRIIQL